MVDNVIAILSVCLPLAFVLFLAWAEFDFKWKRVVLYFLVMGLPVLAVLLWHPFDNLTDWQLGAFVVLFALALVGISHLVERRKSNRSRD